MAGSGATYTDVTRDNIVALAAGIRRQIAQAKFVAVDTEFTGLVIGNASPVFRFNTAEWVTRATDMRERYRAMANVAKTHALVSMGLTVFAQRHTALGSYNVHSFNFLLQAQNTHLVNPTSLAFLAQNGFDLGRQATHGIRYFAGPNPHPVQVMTPEINAEGALVREIFLDVVRTRRPLVVHNGLFDLVYLYQSFFGPLPDTHESFVSDLCEMFPGGIFDTKLIAEAADPGTASYLAYLYHKSRRTQRRRREAGDPAVQARLKVMVLRPAPALPSPPPPPPPQSAAASEKPYCEQFALHGHCRLRERCPRSHDIEFILDCQEREPAPEPAPEQPAPARKRKGSGTDGGDRPRKAPRANGSGSAPRASSPEPAQQAAEIETLSISEDGGSGGARQAEYHTAAYDAYMTGYVFASLRLLLGDRLDAHRNKVYRMGRSSEPLLIRASPYSATSVTYRQTAPLLGEQPPPGSPGPADPGA
ncbi:hypothetical protein H4R18_000147 [Coemansia javaensis]|uniref:C3H1-type domain-containing protein n=1 Tax=Coemansia javaensis TaxID=2761396 RepID=A0A9W8HKL9_9FUNG|nr:hypothetical protein H4R18_000147 [Coemansia javaensis]